MKNKKLFAILTLVCFMFTLMPVAAFAGGAVVDQSVFVRYDDEEVIKAGETATFYFQAKDASGAVVKGEALDFYVWAVDADGNVSSALENVTCGKKVKAATDKDPANTFVVTKAETGDKFKLTFARKGTYTVYAGVINGSATANLANAQLLGGGAFDTVTVIGKTAVDPEEKYRASVAGTVLDYNKATGLASGVAGVACDGETMGTVSVVPNNVAEKVTVKFTQSGMNISDVTKKDSKWNQNDLAGLTVAVSTDSANIELDKETYKTDVLGEIDLKLSASREGNYNIYLDVNGVEFTLAVACGNTDAAYITTTEEPEALVALYETDVDVVFTITDINGNMVKDAERTETLFEDGDVKYLFFTEKPEASTLTNDSIALDTDADNGKYALEIDGTLDAEGKYAIKAILDNGAFATASWEVKKFQTPVMLYMEVADVVELGKEVVPTAKYADVNGVTKVAKDAKYAATGYAVASLTDYNNGYASVVAKTDEKYAGTSYTLTAVSERYDLVATKEIKVANEATTIKFVETNLAVNVNNKVDWFVADEEGTKVRINTEDWIDTKYIVLDKPEGAKVTVYDAVAFDNGEGTMALTSNKIGNVTVQIIGRAVPGYKTTTGVNDNTAVQTKYYTATQIFAVGTEGVGDVVVMSIGSNEIVINDAKAAIDAAPIVENNRTFVPFRALAEAFGATVAYDEATQAVTAELNGVTVVMTIGSAEYTVNGVAKTADVAPFINGSRTMVPVRFAAEAFGIKVIPTYDENGATADILFNL